MHITKTYIAAILIASLTIPAYSAELQAPLGLEWGMTQGQAKIKGIKLDCNLTQLQGLPQMLGFTVCETKNPPKPVFSIAKHYWLKFFPKHGLHQVMVIGHDITLDAYGFKGKELHESLKARLTKKYGVPERHHEYTKNSIVYDQEDEFYECLAHPRGCGHLATYWTLADGGGLTLELEGVRRGEGYIMIVYDSAKHDEILESHEQRQADQDDGGL